MNNIMFINWECQECGKRSDHGYQNHTDAGYALFEHLRDECAKIKEMGQINLFDESNCAWGE